MCGGAGMYMHACVWEQGSVGVASYVGMKVMCSMGVLCSVEN